MKYEEKRFVDKFIDPFGDPEFVDQEGIQSDGVEFKIVGHDPSLAKPAFMIKIIPHVDCTPRICELVRYHMTDIVMKGAWESPAALELFSHVACDVNRLPVREVISGAHFVAWAVLSLAVLYLAGAF